MTGRSLHVYVPKGKTASAGLRPLGVRLRRAGDAQSDTPRVYTRNLLRSLTSQAHGSALGGGHLSTSAAGMARSNKRGYAKWFPPTTKRTRAEKAARVLP